MPSTDRDNFRLTWIIERYSLYAESVVNEEQRIPFPTSAHFSTDFLIDVYPRTEQLCLECTISNYTSRGVEGQIALEYSISVIGVDGNVISFTKGEYRLAMGDDRHIKIVIIPLIELGHERLPDDRLKIVFAIVRTRCGPRPDDIVVSTKWPDELSVLSDDIGRMLETGRLSDVELVASDGQRVRCHRCILHARWPQLLVEGRVAHLEMKGSLLVSFLSYLYRGVIPSSDLTVELFQLVCVFSSPAKIKFYTLPSQISVRTRKTEERLVLSWHLSTDPPPYLCRIVALQQVFDGDLIVEISTEDSQQIAVEFSLSKLPSYCVRLRCTATVPHRPGEDPVVLSADHHFETTFTPWRFPHPMPSTHGCGRVDFELTVTTSANPTHGEYTKTEFGTGSLDVRFVEMLATQLMQFFIGDSLFEFNDIRLFTEEGFFPSCMSVLCARSSTIMQICERAEGNVDLHVANTDFKTLCSVMQYVYTGWTKIETIREAIHIHRLAERWNLSSLVTKCVQWISYYSSRRLTDRI